MGKKYTNFAINLDGLDQEENWYALMTSYNYEQYVVDKIKSMNDNLDSFVSDAFIPIENVPVEVKRKGQTKIEIKQNKVMPNYVFIKTRLSIDKWKLLMNVTGVTSIMCVAGIPSIISEKEINRMKALSVA